MSAYVSERENINNIYPFCKTPLNFIYTGCQIISKKIFQNLSKNIFSINEIWDRYIKKGNLYGFESAIEFLHLTDKEIYEKILLKNVKI